MSQLMHHIIALILWELTWRCFLKKHPIMQENLREWDKWFSKNLF